MSYQNGTLILEVRSGGSDSANGGGFDTGLGFAANGAISSANTSAPVLTSVSYNFVAGDVGKPVFLKSGTNLIPGFYTIASVNAGAATLTATIGSATLYINNTFQGLNTVVGCSASANLSGIAWGIDYSQQDAAQFTTTSYSSPSATPANSMTVTGSGPNMIGNTLVIPSGVTNATAGNYRILNFTGGNLSLDRNWNTGSVTTGGNAIGIGGGFATPGYAASFAITGGMIVFVKYNASAYVATSASTNVSGGCVSGTANSYYQGYNTSRWLFNSDSLRPTFQVGSGVSSATLFGNQNTFYNVIGLILDGNNQTGSVCAKYSGLAFYVKVMNGVAGGLTGNTNGSIAFYVEATGCSAFPITFITNYFCESYANSTTGIQPSGTAGYYYSCLSYNNTGASSHGFASSNNCLWVNCVAYNNNGNGFTNGNATITSSAINCVAESNAGYGYQTNTGNLMLRNCADFNNTSGRSIAALNGWLLDFSPIIEVASGFTNAASGNFAPIAPLLAAAFPSLFPAGTTANFLDVGAAQAQSSSGGGSTGFFIQ